ncbi:Glycogen phosphorylase 1 [Vitis vinifera]|uniref:Alpha-1,4 glucan phosphorylase n=1 Tax=Vitis vinifera TaxID=29760 RepID=A0A438DRC8_VITVI|nr:Glycogen phosphorylase 1 [Vitis vinifera]
MGSLPKTLPHTSSDSGQRPARNQILGLIVASLLKLQHLRDFYELWPHKFQYKTNGVTQRRWIVVSNPSLCALISKWLGTEAWIRDIDLLIGLQEFAADADLHQEWKMVRKVNKMRLAEYIEAMSGVKVSLDAMFDVQIKRIHEYKRQLLNILSIIHRYDCIKNMEKTQRRKVVPRVCIVGGKAAPGYEVAKKIIKLCHAVAEKINNDADVGDLLKLVKGIYVWACILTCVLSNLSPRIGLSPPKQKQK